MSKDVSTISISHNEESQIRWDENCRIFINACISCHEEVKENLMRDKQIEFWSPIALWDDSLVGKEAMTFVLA
jgi:hypothetical protein